MDFSVFSWTSQYSCPEYILQCMQYIKPQLGFSGGGGGGLLILLPPLVHPSTYEDEGTMYKHTMNGDVGFKYTCLQTKHNNKMYIQQRMDSRRRNI